MHCCLISAVLSLLGGAEPADKAGTTMMFRGIVDSTGKVGYFQRQNKGIVALDLKTGKEVWFCEDADQPLLVLSEGRLLAYRPKGGDPSTIEIVVMDDRGQVKETMSEKLGGAVRLVPEQGKSFRARARAEKDTIVIEWDYHQSYVGGAPPPPEILEEIASGCASGRLTVDLAKKSLAGEKTERKPLEDGPRELRVAEMILSVEDDGRGKHTLCCKDARSEKELWRHPVRGYEVFRPRP